jgi:hypothetical protein
MQLPVLGAWHARTARLQCKLERPAGKKKLCSCCTYIRPRHLHRIRVPRTPERRSFTRATQYNNASTHHSTAPSPGPPTGPPSRSCNKQATEKVPRAPHLPFSSAADTSTYMIRSRTKSVRVGFLPSGSIQRKYCGMPPAGHQWLQDARSRRIAVEPHPHPRLLRHPRGVAEVAVQVHSAGIVPLEIRRLSAVCPKSAVIQKNSRF